MNQDIANEEVVLLTVSAEDLERFSRLDHFLTQKMAPWGRSFLKKLFEKDLIYAEDSQIILKLKKMPPAGTVVVIQIPPPTPIDLIPENIPLQILYEDEHLLFINKPAGLVTHPGPGNESGTLANAVLFHCPNLRGIGGERRPGIVHRLDKGTSGVMVVAKEQIAHESLALLFSTHDITRVYQALVLGVPPKKEGTIESTIGRHPVHRQKMAADVARGRRAVSHYRVLETFEGLSHLQITLETGRTHQIRVHLGQVLHCPIINDETYGNPSAQFKKIGPLFENLLKDYPYPLLHARTLGLKHPMSGKDMLFEVEPPAHFQEVLTLARSLKR